MEVERKKSMLSLFLRRKTKKKRNKKKHDAREPLEYATTPEAGTLASVGLAWTRRALVEGDDGDGDIDADVGSPTPTPMPSNAASPMRLKK